MKRESAPICQNRTIWQRIRGLNRHAWTTETSLYGTQERTCLWCGKHQHKRMGMNSWVTVK